MSSALPAPTAAANPAQPTPVPQSGSPPAAAKSKDLKSWWSRFNVARKTSATAEQPTGIFGVPLRQSIAYANVAISLVDAEGKSYIYGYVPIVVAKCGVYLKEKATNVEGIFRLSGSSRRIKELQAIFDAPDKYGKGLDWAGYTVHDAANVLRRYLNQLPEPIVPLTLYERFRDPLRGVSGQAVNDASAEDKAPFDINVAISTYQQLITELPPLNRQLLLYILDLLAVFASKSEENRMDSANLSAIFQPGLISHPTHDMAPSEYQLSQNVLIFLIENQDHFLIGMSGTAADEQTVAEVQNGGTPPPATPTTPIPSRSKTTVGRSSSNGSAGADSVRKYGGVRRNVSVSSKHSRQSNGAPSPASPAYGATLTQTSSGGVHRSNTVPSKRSPALSNRLQKTSGSPSPNAVVVSPPDVATARGVSPGPTDASSQAPKSAASSTVAPTAIGVSSLAPAASAITAQRSHEHLLQDPEKADSHAPAHTLGPAFVPKERSVSNLFQRSGTGESEKKPPNKLRKKRLPEGSNASAQSSQNSLHGGSSVAHSPASPPTIPSHPVIDHAMYPLETVQSGTPLFSRTDATPPVMYGTSTGILDGSGDPNAANPYVHPLDPPQSSDGTLKPTISATNSLRSHTSTNDQSDFEHSDDPMAVSDQLEKRRRWRLSRRKDSQGNPLGPDVTSPKKMLGSNLAAESSTTSFHSIVRPKKSFTTGDGITSGSETSMTQATPGHGYSNSESGLGAFSKEEKTKNPIDWLKAKMRGDKEEKKAQEPRDAEKSDKEKDLEQPVRARSVSLSNTRGTVIPEPVRHAADTSELVQPKAKEEGSATTTKPSEIATSLPVEHPSSIQTTPLELEAPSAPTPSNH